MKKTYLIILLITSSVYSQKEVLNEKISFKYEENIYNDIAKDSISVLYNRQKKYYQENKTEINEPFYSNAISLKYKLEDLSYFIIPQFKLYNTKEKEYNCKNKIENFINFNNSSKYFKALIKTNKEFVGSVNVPNFIFEYQKLYKEDVFTSYLKSQYINYYLNDFTLYNMSNYSMIDERSKNFFFEIYGLDNVVFEIDNESGLMYANYFSMFIDEENVPRLLANEFIRKYVGENIIIELSKGNYKDIDLVGSIVEFKPCKDVKYDSSNIIVEVIK